MTRAEQRNPAQDWNDQPPDASVGSNLRQAYPTAAFDELPRILRDALDRLQGRIPG